MTPEEKGLLLKDLCARLPYGVKLDNGLKLRSIDMLTEVVSCSGSDKKVENVRPYLRPMSSMTKDEREEIEVFIFNKWYQENSCKIDKEGWIEILANYDVSGIDPCFCSDYVDWLNAHHFDYLGLIEKGLALEAPEDMYKID